MFVMLLLNKPVMAGFIVPSQTSGINPVTIPTSNAIPTITKIVTNTCPTVISKSFTSH